MERVAAALEIRHATARSLIALARKKLAVSLSDLKAAEVRVFDTKLMPSMLHITNGDSAAEKLRQSGVPGTVGVWGDTLYEGPVPREAGDAAFREARGRFHAGAHFSYEECLAIGDRWNRTLESADAFDEVVLWFEHDLHDQLILVYLLDWFARRPHRPHKLSLICIGEFPGVKPFYGLGQLDPDQIASLLGTRQSVTERQLALAQSTWRAFTGDDPTAIERVIGQDTSSLQFLASAVVRLLEEFPNSKNGLPRTERMVLELLAELGPMTFRELFPLYMRREKSPFMGDTTLWNRIEDLARGARPLISREETNVSSMQFGGTLAINNDGRRTLAGELDWMSIASTDRWIGGSHLVAPNILWRWSRVTATLLRTAQQAIEVDDARDHSTKPETI